MIKMVKTRLGIDLGTRNSAAAFVDESGESVIVHFQESETADLKRRYGNEAKHIFPSVVAYDEYGECMHVGEMATRFEGAFWDVKRYLGKSYEEALKEKEKLKHPYTVIRGSDGEAKFKIGEKEVLPEEILSELLKKIKIDAEKHYNRLYGSEILFDRIKITVPAYFGRNHKIATKRAGEFAGFENVHLIPEPVAAAIACMHAGKFDEDDRYALVFDLGAGTLDIVIVDHRILKKASDEEIEKLKLMDITGNIELGGDDMDSKIVDWVIEELKKDKIDVNDDYIEEIRKKVEQAKIDLSTDLTAPIHLDRLGKSITLTREKLEGLISEVPLSGEGQPFLEKCRTELNNGFKNAKIGKDEIDKVLLIGGPTKMPIIRKMIKEEIGDYIIEDHEISPMLCVAEGACLKDIPIIVGKPYGLIKYDQFEEVAKKGVTMPIRKTVTWDILPSDTRIPIHIVQEKEHPYYDTIGKEYDILVDPTIGNVQRADITFKLSREEELDITVEYGGSKIELPLKSRKLFKTKESNLMDLIIKEFVGDKSNYNTSYVMVAATHAMLSAVNLSEFMEKSDQGKVKEAKNNLESYFNVVHIHIIRKLSELINEFGITEKNIKEGIDEEVRQRMREIEKALEGSKDFLEVKEKMEVLGRVLGDATRRMRWSVEQAKEERVKAKTVLEKGMAVRNQRGDEIPKEVSGRIEDKIAELDRAIVDLETEMKNAVMSERGVDGGNILKVSHLQVELDALLELA